MCGIAGIWSKKSLDCIEMCRKAELMLNAMVHRGPDDGGYAVDSHIFLGNRRLKIFDLSDAGNQPFFNDDGKIWLVLNGEICNHYELRRELENEFAFRSTSVTEVLLRSYEKWGIECLDRLIGMFAFAIWDAHDQKYPVFMSTHNLRTDMQKDFIFRFRDIVNNITKDHVSF